GPAERPGTGASAPLVDRVKPAAITLDGGAEVVDIVVAELLAERVGEDEREHRLGDDAGRRNDADIAPFDVRGGWLTRPQVRGRERLHERRDRLERDLDDDVLAVRHAALEAACAVPRSRECAIADDDRIVHSAA